MDKKIASKRYTGHQSLIYEYICFGLLPFNYFRRSTLSFKTQKISSYRRRCLWCCCCRWCASRARSYSALPLASSGARQGKPAGGRADDQLRLRQASASTRERLANQGAISYIYMSIVWDSNYDTWPYEVSHGHLALSNAEDGCNDRAVAVY